MFYFGDNCFEFIESVLGVFEPGAEIMPLLAQLSDELECFGQCRRGVLGELRSGTRDVVQR
jgi:hypothetical protein